MIRAIRERIWQRRQQLPLSALCPLPAAQFVPAQQPSATYFFVFYCSFLQV